MNASPVITPQFALLWMLIPALICLFGIGIGIVTAFRRGDARVPLAIGGLGFVAILFSLPFTSSPGRVQSSPIDHDHFPSSDMQPLPVFNTQIAVVPLIFLVLIGGAMVFGIVAAIRHGYGKVVLIVGAVGLVGLLLAGFTSTSVRVQNSPTAFDHATSQPLQSPPGFAPPWIMLLAPAFAGLVLWAALQRRDRVAGQMLVPLLVAGACFGGVLILHLTLRSPGPYPYTSIPEPPRIPSPAAVPGETSVTSYLATQPSASATPTGPAPSQILYTTGNAHPIPIQELPGWRKNPPHEGTLGAGRAKYVLTSEQFATVEEAEAKLFRSLAVDVQESFARYYTPAVGWHPTPEDLRLSGIIAERVVETFSVKVGEFENPVHRVSWLIEFDHDKSTVLLKRWEPIEAQRRAKLILSILAGASSVLGVTAMALRRRRDQPIPIEAPTSGAA